MKITLFNKSMKFVSYFVLVLLISTNAHAFELGVGVGNTAPDFTVTNLKGEQFKLSDYQGKKPVYLIFWATWCPACKREIPQFTWLHQEYENEVEILAVNIDALSWWSSLKKSDSRVDKYIDENKISYSVALDDDQRLTKLFDVQGTPTQLLIDKNGVILRRQPFLTKKTVALLQSIL